MPNLSYCDCTYTLVTEFLGGKEEEKEENKEQVIEKEEEEEEEEKDAVHPPVSPCVEGENMRRCRRKRRRRMRCSVHRVQ